MVHILLHFIVPAVVAVFFFRKRVAVAVLVMYATMLVDLDHLVAEPVYDPLRCSLGFHPFHQTWLFAVYALLALVPKSRLIGLGLCIHMVLDGIDCKVTTDQWLHVTQRHSLIQR